jgi:hypothetical protein
MKKATLSLILTALILAACGAPPTTPPQAAPTDTAIAQPTATRATLPTLAVTATRPLVNPGNMMPGCTVVSIKPSPVAPEDSIFGPISEQDWVIGPPTATVTLLEYSDFQ